VRWHGICQQQQQQQQHWCFAGIAWHTTPMPGLTPRLAFGSSMAPSLLCWQGDGVRTSCCVVADAHQPAAACTAECRAFVRCGSCSCRQRWHLGVLARRAGAVCALSRFCMRALHQRCLAPLYTRCISLRATAASTLADGCHCNAFPCPHFIRLATRRVCACVYVCVCWARCVATPRAHRPRTVCVRRCRAYLSLGSATRRCCCVIRNVVCGVRLSPNVRQTARVSVCLCVCVCVRVCTLSCVPPGVVDARMCVLAWMVSVWFSGLY
jgi:hypothetical protein